MMAVMVDDGRRGWCWISKPNQPVASPHGGFPLRRPRPTKGAQLRFRHDAMDSHIHWCQLRWPHAFTDHQNGVRHGIKPLAGNQRHVGNLRAHPFRPRPNR